MEFPASLSVIPTLLFLALLPWNFAAASFGEAIDDKVTDYRFRDMGQAYVSEFEIVDSVTTFQVILEDTLNQPEYWVVDFQKYDANDDTAVDPQTGDIHPENTGECSNVIFEAPYQPGNLATGYYFSDVGNFVSRNVTLLSDQLTNGNAAHKRLFTSYTRGTNFTELDSDGNNIQRRDYILSFDEDFGFFFNCTDTTGSNIWRYIDNVDSIEFQTTIYFTNVRPVDPADGTKGMSWVTSSVDLIYRLTRVIIVNFVVSSTALVKPVLDYVIIKSYYPPETPTIPNAKRATITMQFKTTIESPNNELLSFYNATMLEYVPRNETTGISLNLDLNYVYPDGPQQCQYVSTAKCRQTWNFQIVLDLDVEVEDSELPIDATGTFKFKFAKYQCNDPTVSFPVDCTDMNEEPLTISIEVTIQTVVQVLDSSKDVPRVDLVSMTGENGEDLRSGGGRRGVNHLEPVSIVVKYFPEVLRKDFDLDLTLFMVCRSDWSSVDEGCLGASLSQRYIAFSSENFNYVIEAQAGLDESGVPFPDLYMNSTDLEDDNTAQSLTTNAYDTLNNVYNMGFVNTALSQQRQTYTITTVFRLLPKTGRRRRRAVDVSAPRVLSTRLGGAADEMTRGLVPYGSTRPRQRRDLMDAVSLPQDHTVAMVFNGCPERSTFDAANFHCKCDLPEEKYSTVTYSCLGPEPVEPEVKVIDVQDVQLPGSGGAPSCVATVGLILTAHCVVVMAWLRTVA